MACRTFLLYMLTLLSISSCTHHPAAINKNNHVQETPLTNVFLHSPKNQMENVPINTSLHLYLRNVDNLNTPLDMSNVKVTLKNNSTDKSVPLKMLINKRNVITKTKQKLYWLMFQPQEPLAGNQSYTLLYNNNDVSSFRTSADSTSTGELLKITPLKFQLPGCRHSYFYEPSDVFMCQKSLFSFARKLPDNFSAIKSIAILPNDIQKDILSLAPRIAHAEEKDFTYHVQSELIEYTSQTPDGKSVILSAALLSPLGPRLPERLEVVSIQHSWQSSKLAQTDMRSWEVYIGLLLASHGYHVVLGDTLGHGLSKDQQDSSASRRSNGMQYSHLLKVVGKYLQDEYGAIAPIPLNLYGYSQGGYDTLALYLDHWEVTPLPFEVKNVYIGASPYDFSLTSIESNAIRSSLSGQSINQSHETLTILHEFLHSMTKYELQEQSLKNIGNVTQIQNYVLDPTQHPEWMEILQINVVSPDSEFISNADWHIYHSIYDNLIPIEPAYRFYHDMQKQQKNNLLSHLTWHDCFDKNEKIIEAIQFPEAHDVKSHNLCTFFVANDFLKKLDTIPERVETIVLGELSEESLASLIQEKLDQSPECNK